VLTNAAKYTGTGGRIRLEVEVSNDQLEIRVIDNGCGISPELLPHVFDLFVQSERTLDRSLGGLGIGLSVVKRLIEMHGGSVLAESAGVGHGARITLRLPRIAGPPQAASVPRALRIASRRILVVDDNRDAADSLTMLLAGQGHKAQAVYSAQEVLELAERAQAEFILLDVGLPEMDGYEVARRLREIPALRRTRLVAVTGYGQSEDRERARAVGFVAHVTKPASLAQLERILAGPRGRKRD
jgi:CheY-like chemotaxis protein